MTDILHLHCAAHQAHQGLKPLADNQSPLKRTGNGFQSSLEDFNLLARKLISGRERRLIENGARSEVALTVRAVALALTKQDTELIKSRLTFQVNPQYQRIDTNALFNLNASVRLKLRNYATASAGNK